MCWSLLESSLRLFCRTRLAPFCILGWWLARWVGGRKGRKWKPSSDVTAKREKGGGAQNKLGGRVPIALIDLMLYLNYLETFTAASGWRSWARELSLVTDMGLVSQIGLSRRGRRLYLILNFIFILLLCSHSPPDWIRLSPAHSPQGASLLAKIPFSLKRKFSERGKMLREGKREHRNRLILRQFQRLCGALSGWDGCISWWGEEKNTYFANDNA